GQLQKSVSRPVAPVTPQCRLNEVTAGISQHRSPLIHAAQCVELNVQWVNARQVSTLQVPRQYTKTPRTFTAHTPLCHHRVRYLCLRVHTSVRHAFLHRKLQEGEKVGRVQIFAFNNQWA